MKKEYKVSVDPKVCDSSKLVELQIKRFGLTVGQHEQYMNWRKALPKVDYGTTGGGYTFMFTPTGLGDIIKVRRDDGYEIDLTEIDKW
jgi:hypothetical protein